MNATTDAVDIAKNVFQIHWVDVGTGEISRRKLSCIKVVEFFAQRLPSPVLIEACGGAHHWARTLTAVGLPSRVAATAPGALLRARQQG